MCCSYEPVGKSVFSRDFSENSWNFYGLWLKGATRLCYSSLYQLALGRPMIVIMTNTLFIAY